MKKKICILPHVLLFMGIWFSAVCVSGQSLPNPQRFEGAILQFEAQDKINPPAEGGIVLTGSSSIARWNDQAQDVLSPLTVISRGFGGSVMNDVLHYLERVALVYKPRAILIYEGDNDVWLDNPVIPNTVIVDQLKSIIEKIHNELPGARVYVLSVKPSISRWRVWPAAQALSQEFKLIAEKNPLVHYIDVATPLLDDNGVVMKDIFVEDNLHLNNKGYEIWGRTIKEALMHYEAEFE